MQFGHYLNFFMESIEVAEAKVTMTDYKVALVEMLAYKIKGWASEVEQEF